MDAYKLAAERIIEEFDARGFTTDDPSNLESLKNKIKNIIIETLTNNTNYYVSNDEPSSGWETDLQNQ